MVQGAAGSVSAAGAVYDGIQELREDEYNHSISLYDQMERNRVEDKSLPRKVGEAAGFTAAATAGVHNPEIFLSGAAQNARHIGERQIHEKARDKFYKPEQTAS